MIREWRKVRLECDQVGCLRWDEFSAPTRADCLDHFERKGWRLSIDEKVATCPDPAHRFAAAWTPEPAA